MNSDVHIDESALAKFCDKWQVRELSLFGSALREDFNKDSDLDFLVNFDQSARLTIDVWLDMKDELESICRRPVDLVDKSALRNPWRRNEILSHSKVLYSNA